MPDRSMKDFYINLPRTSQEDGGNELERELTRDLHYVGQGMGKQDGKMGGVYARCAQHQVSLSDNHHFSGQPRMELSHVIIPIPLVSLQSHAYRKRSPSKHYSYVYGNPGPKKGNIVPDEAPGGYYLLADLTSLPPGKECVYAHLAEAVAICLSKACRGRRWEAFLQSRGATLPQTESLGLNDLAGIEDKTVKDESRPMVTSEDTFLLSRE